MFGGRAATGNLSKPASAFGTGGRVSSIDALRGIGALWVCGYHARQILWVGLSEATRSRKSNWDPMWWLELMTYPLSFGGAGVALFFVVSGYCIHRSQVRRRGEKLEAWPYLRRRFLRIYPVMVAALIITAGLDAVSRSQVPGHLKLGDNGLTTLIANGLTLQGIVSPNYGSNAPLWSLAVEVHLYLAYLGLYRILQKTSVTSLVGLSLAFSVASQIWLTVSGSRMVLFLPYVFTWSLGVLVAELESKGELRVSAKQALVVAFPTLVAGCALVHSNQVFGSWVVWGISFAAWLAWSLTLEGSRFLGRAGLRWLPLVGTISYSLYAIHHPVLLFCQTVFLHGVVSPSLVAPFLGIGACVGAGFLLYIAVERWSVRVSHSHVAIHSCVSSWRFRP